jgi:DNA polymerase
MKVHIDFETRSTVDIWETGAWVYSAHPTTHVHCIGYAVDNEDVKLVSDFNDLNTLRYLASNPEVIFVAHNAYFEQCIWRNIMVKKYGMPSIPIQRWRCTMAKALAYSLPKALEKASDALGIYNRKDKAGRQVMLRMAKPLKAGTEEYDEKPESLKLLYEYCKQDVRVEREIDNALPDLSTEEQEIWFYDQLINTRGLHVDMATVRKFINILENKTEALNRELIELTDGKVTKGTQIQSMLAFLNEGGARMESLNKQSVAEAIKTGKLSDIQIKVLRLRQQLGKSSLAKYKKLMEAVDEKGVLRDCFVYHAASTGRWGGKLVQLQNLPKGKIDTDKAIADINTYGYPAIEMMYPGKIMEVLSACIRGLFVPAKGHELYIVDYGAIEARIVMWLAWEEQGLKEFKATDAGTDEDIYVKMAQRIYGNPALTKKNSAERQLGKQAILGCGYGMGAHKFMVTCAGYGIQGSEDEASRIVNLYRSTYYNVKNYWYDMEQAMLTAFRNPGELSPCKGIGWIYIKESNAMYCRLLSGRILTYVGPQMKENKFGNMGMSFMTEVNTQWVRRETYGGLLVENITQATARDIMAYSIPRLEEAGFPVLMHTHDEIVSERLTGVVRMREMIGLMCERPAWAKTCPIVAEGFTGQRYKKG